MITQRSVQEILDTAKIDDVVEEFVNLRKRGVNMIGLCPFHNEKTPSFTVSPSKNIFKCFGCGRGGNPVQFLMEHEKMTFPEALKYLAAKYNIEVEETERTQEDIEASKVKDSYFIINDFALSIFKNNLFDTDEGKSVGLTYFKERGYLEETVKKFQLGYAMRSRDHFTKKALDKGYNMEYLKSLGLTSSRDMDFFNGRVMFSFHNLSGKIIGFGGRTLSSASNVPKYLNSSESDIFNKRNTLYGLYFAKSAIRTADECILVEGYTDVLTLHQSGIENTVASSGTALTVQQIRSIKRFTDNVKIIYDGDPAGIKAAMRGLDLVLEQNMNVKLVLLPDQSDPDSYLNEVGREEFLKFLEEEAKDFIFFKLTSLLKESKNDPIKRSKVAKDIIDSIARIPDSLKRSFYLKECSQLLGVSEKILMGQTNKKVREIIRKKKLEQKISDARAETTEYQSDGAPFPGESLQDDIVTDGSSFQEKDLIRIIMTMGSNLMSDDQDISVAQYIIMNIEEVIDKFENSFYREIVLDAAKAISDGKKLNHHFYTSHHNAKIQELAVDMYSDKYEYSGNWEKRWGVILQTQKKPEENFKRDSYQAVLRFKLKVFNREIKKLKEKKANNEIQDETLFLKLHQSYIKARNEIARELNTIVVN